MIAHFFDLDTILVTNAKVWIVDKTLPSVPILKISQSDFNLIRNGVYKSQGNRIDFSGDEYWLPNDIYERLKIKAKNHRADIGNLGFSMQEFLNKELIENLEYDLNIDNILHLKNTNDDIYIICSKNTQKNHELVISKIEDKLEKNGLKIKKFYYISETFYNRKGDEIAHKKVRLLLQHLVGYKTDIDKFTEEKLTKYSQIFYYDDEQIAINLAIDCNNLLMLLIDNSESTIKELLKQELKSQHHILFVNEVTGNRVNRFVTTEVLLKYSNLIKAFESFRFR